MIIDVEFFVDEDRFKSAQLGDDASGVSDISDAGVRDAINRVLIASDWSEQGLAPLHSTITSRRP